ncbi:unnamed protein product [Cuscuta epithymum]|uniref:VQ domain-containing protein n=1 Tax=Cuscuta epithymum TaxID=186058 RepID=A0AAV0EYT8_9ASTE|nr:unnamed protein product [Cuscuta epithymum]
MEMRWSSPEVKSPRKEIQGPRPTPLKVHKDSHKIRKPPPVPHPPQAAPPRPPVIIYTLSPKIIHANPSDFMSLVQRLTGSLPAEPSSSSQAAFQGYLTGGAVSPAACFASLEKTRTTPKGRDPQLSRDVEGMVGGVEISGEVERSGYFPAGVLSPTPASFPPIPPSFFSPPSDQNHLGFFTDLISPVLHSSRYHPETSFYISSPSILNNFISPRFIFSPGSASLELFSNDLFDLPATHTL